MIIKMPQLSDFFPVKPPHASSQSVSRDSQQPPLMILLLWDAIKFGTTLYVSWKLVGLVYSALGVNQALINKEAKKDLAKRLKRPEIELMDFSKHEQHYFNHIIAPGDIDSSFNDIGGLESELEDVKENVILPIRIWNRFKSFKGFTPCPTGVLLYGLPGTGKSLTAKAIAKEANATFINVKASALMDKYLGESDKLASALFSLGRKLAPTIIFLDEVDTILKKRESSSLDKHMSSVQGVILSEWDGLSDGRTADASTCPGPVVVLAATNRPNDLDPALLRRLPVRIKTRMPDAEGRLSILTVLLKNDVLDMGLDLEDVASRIVDFSGSDIRELVRLAKQHRSKLYLKSNNDVLSALMDDTAGKSPVARSVCDLQVDRAPLTTADFAQATLKLMDTSTTNQEYQSSIRSQEQNILRFLAQTLGK